jgi:hypothetical protein
MKTLHYTLLCTLLCSAQARAQSIANPGFESACTFDITGWERFCSSPDYYYGDGHNSCYSLALPTSDSNSPCFSNGDLIGMHTLMSGVLAGVPYQLSLYENMSSPDVNSDCGIFAMPAGQTPTSFGGAGVLLDTWPVGFSNPGVWMQDIMNFTIAEQYAGMDFYFFIEYSAAPDIVPGMKYFDDITITDLSTGMPAGTTLIPHHWPDPAQDELFIDMTEAPSGLVAFDAMGRAIQLGTFHHRDGTLEVDVSSIPSGLCVMLVKTASGVRTVRFIKA